jgi:hypothetical protein
MLLYLVFGNMIHKDFLGDKTLKSGHSGSWASTFETKNVCSVYTSNPDDPNKKTVKVMPFCIFSFS